MRDDVRWTNLTLAEIAQRLKDVGTPVSVTVVKQLLCKHRYVPRKDQKSQTMGQHADRNQQFENIARLKRQYLESDNPILSIDTKKKELVTSPTELNRRGAPEHAQAASMSAERGSGRMTRQKTRTPRPTRLPKRRKGPSDRPGSPVPSVSATREATQAFRFFDADARSTFPPASLGRSTRDTLPMPRTLRPPKPSRSFSPLFVDAIPTAARTAPGTRRSPLPRAAPQGGAPCRWIRGRTRPHVVL